VEARRRRAAQRLILCIEASPLSRFREGGVSFGKSGGPRATRLENFQQFDLNLAIGRGDQERGREMRGRSVLGHYPMESIRPNNTDPIPVQASQHHVGTILLRFIGILIATIAVMALLWSR
jgi:hypothetical protein